jgi:hypothetical protein
MGLMPLLLLLLIALYQNRAAIYRDLPLIIGVAVGIVIIGPLILWIAAATGSDLAALLAIVVIAGLAGLCT